MRLRIYDLPLERSPRFEKELRVDLLLARLLKLNGSADSVREALRLLAAHVDDHQVAAAVERIIADRRFTFRSLRTNWIAMPEQTVGGGEGR